MADGVKDCINIEDAESVADPVGKSAHDSPTSLAMPLQWRIQEGQIRPWPPVEVGKRSLAPLGSRKSNDSIVNLWKSKDFGPE